MILSFFEKNNSFTLIELLVVIAIIMILASIVTVQVSSYIDNATMARAKSEMRTMKQAIEMYVTDHNYQYPEDVNRGMPPGLEQYLSSKPNWPDAAWDNSYYDYDRWDSDYNPKAGNLAYSPYEEVIQISIRFCKLGDPSSCDFPNTEWAENFDYHSSIYWCIKGPCRAHGSKPFDHPGCCMGGNCSSAVRKCK